MSTINLEALLKPISAEQPTGIDLRQNTEPNSLYYEIKDARNLARDIERQITMGMGDGERPRWDTVLNLCCKALEAHTKDLEVASWLVEALVRQDGFKGLATGFNVIKHLAELYWDTLYPLPEGDDLETRLAPLVSLNGEDYEGTLIAPINHLLITQGSSVSPFALWQYQQALDNMKLKDKVSIEKRKATGSIFMAEVLVALRESSPQFYEHLQKDLNSAKQSLEQFNITMESKCGKQAPPVSRVLNALNNFSDHIRYLLKDAPFKLNLDALEEKPMSTETTAVNESSSEPQEKIDNVQVPNTTNIKNRKEALRLLGDVAEFFKQTEPQSPLPLLLERAISLGKLSFLDLLKALVADEKARGSAYDLLGVESKSNVEQ